MANTTRNAVARKAAGGKSPKIHATGSAVARKTAGGKSPRGASAAAARASVSRRTKQQRAAGSGRSRGRPRGSTNAQKGGSQGPRGRSASLGKRQSSAVKGAADIHAEQLRKSMLRRKRSQVVFQCDWKKTGHAKKMVFLGLKQKTSGGLVKRDLKKNKRGTVVSKVRSAHGKARFLANRLDRWCQSLLMARKDMRLEGFVKIKSQRNGGKGVSAELHRRMREHWALLMLNAVNSSLKGDGLKGDGLKGDGLKADGLKGSGFKGLKRDGSNSRAAHGAKGALPEVVKEEVKQQQQPVTDNTHAMKKEA